jgi:hypothetical protein
VTLLPFHAEYAQNLEVRTRTYGTGTLDQCGIHILTERDNMVQAINPINDPYHQLGGPLPDNGSRTSGKSRAGASARRGI